MSEPTSAGAANQPVPTDGSAKAQPVQVSTFTGVCMAIGYALGVIGLLMVIFALIQLAHTHSSIVKPAYSTSPAQEMNYLVDQYFVGAFRLVVGLLMMAVGLVAAWLARISWPKS